MNISIHTKSELYSIVNHATAFKCSRLHSISHIKLWKSLMAHNGKYTLSHLHYCNWKSISPIFISIAILFPIEFILIELIFISPKATLTHNFSFSLFGFHAIWIMELFNRLFIYQLRNVQWTCKFWNYHYNFIEIVWIQPSFLDYNVD